MHNVAEKPDDIGERTFHFARDIVRLCLVLPTYPGISWALSKQLIRSATSVGANMVEAQTAPNRVDFVTKTSHARREIREAIFWLRLIEATHISDSAQIADLLEEAQQLQRILTSIIRHTQK